MKEEAIKTFFEDLVDPEGVRFTSIPKLVSTYSSIQVKGSGGGNWRQNQKRVGEVRGSDGEMVSHTL